MSRTSTWEALSKSLEGTPANDEAAWDLRPIEQLDHIGAQLLWSHWNNTWPASLEMSEKQKAVLDQVARYTCSTPDEPPKTLSVRLKAFALNGPRLMIVATDFTRMIGQLALDIGKLISAPHRAPWRDFSGHLYQFGATALPITALVGLLIGVVLAYLTSQQLRQYGAETFIVNILGYGLGPPVIGALSDFLANSSLEQFALTTADCGRGILAANKVNCAIGQEFGLRWAIFIGLFGYLWAGVHFLFAWKTLRKDWVG